MNAAGLDKFWKGANRTISNLFPGIVRFLGTDGTINFEIGPVGVAAGGHRTESRLVPGGMTSEKLTTIRVEKSEWPEEKTLPPKGAFVDLYIVGEASWSTFQLHKIRGYQQGEPAWIFDLISRNR